MPRSLRIVGTLAAFAWTLLVAVAIISLVAAFLQPLALLFISFALLLMPFIAGMLLLVFLSYGFAAIVSLTGTGTPVTTVGLGYATIYMMLATVIADVTIVVLTFVLVVYAPLVSNGLVLFLFTAVPHLVQVLIAYVAADHFAQTGAAGVDNSGECWFRGNLIGMNSAMNVLLITLFYPLLFAPLLALFGTSGASPLAVVGGNIAPILAMVVITAALGTCLLSATVPPALGGAAFLHDWVKGWAGWLSWLMPMSWPSCLYGWLEFYLSWTLHFISLAVGLLAPWLPTVIGPAATPINAFLTSFFPASNLIAEMRLDNGMITLTGGWGGFIPDDHNAGCFSFRGTGPANADVQYLGGHHLNVAAFGWLFSQLDGMLPLPLPRYGTRIAESNTRPAQSQSEVTVWS